MTQIEGKTKRFFSTQSSFSNLCGMHVVNNFLGLQKYNEEQMNEVCWNLSPDCINPHKSIFGGNYDVNVLMAVFQTEGYDLAYHNCRNAIELDHDECGFVLNYELDTCPLFKLCGLGRHWSLIKKETSGFVEYDSLQDSPMPLTHDQLLKRLEELNKPDCTILKITQLNQTEVIVQVKPGTFS
jgi:hypothetical protein